jgi:hypothetical protein
MRGERGELPIKLIVLALIVILIGALILSTCSGMRRRSKITLCADHLTQLLKLQENYQSLFGGKNKEFSDKRGEELWLYGTQTKPPIIGPEAEDLFLCPLVEKHKKCDYRGPNTPLKKLKASDPVGGDRFYNHGVKKGGNILFKDGTVKEFDEDEPGWKNNQQKLQ